MRAAYLVAPGRIEMRDEPIPSPEPGGVVVRIRAALTDGTDLKAFRRGHPQMPMPTRFGHEFSGDITAVGEGTTAFAPGDAIACVHSAPCGACFWCAHEQEELCERVMATKILGAYAEYIAVPAHIVARNAFRKPAALPYTAAAFLEPLACVVHAQDVLAPRAGSRLLVIGDGGFGLLHSLVARARGGCDVLLAGRNAKRLALGASLGVDHTILMTGPDDPVVLDEVRAATGGRGVDAVIECTGALTVWEAAPRFARRGGAVVLFGGLESGTRASFDAARLHYDEVRVLSPFHFTPRAVRAAFDLLVRGALDPLPLVAGTFALSGVGDAFAALAAGNGVKYEIAP